jgi:hypothetical protein
MPEPPALAEEAIAGALEAGFGVRVAGLVFLPVGNDAASWAYRVEVAGGPSWFLKVRAGAGAMPGAAVPAYLAGASCFPRWRPRSPGPRRPTRWRARWPGSGRRTGT